MIAADFCSLPICCSRNGDNKNKKAKKLAPAADADLLDDYRKALHQGQLKNQNMVNDAREQHNIRQWRDTVDGSLSPMAAAVADSR